MKKKSYTIRLAILVLSLALLGSAIFIIGFVYTRDWSFIIMGILVFIGSISGSIFGIYYDSPKYGLKLKLVDGRYIVKRFDKYIIQYEKKGECLTCELPCSDVIFEYGEFPVCRKNDIIDSTKHRRISIIRIPTFLSSICSINGNYINYDKDNQTYTYYKIVDGMIKAISLSVQDVVIEIDEYNPRVERAKDKVIIYVPEKVG